MDIGQGPVRIGILGAARVAEYAMIAPARAEPLAEVVAIAARDRARAQAYAERHQIPRAYDSYAALLDDADIDLVYVATPPVFHARLALDALEAGKHVLVEKPFSMTAIEARRVADAAGTSGLLVAEAMHSRHHRLFPRIAEIVGSGILGELASLSGIFVAPIARNPEEFRWQRALGGGALMDLGVYPLAWLRAVTGEEPETTEVMVEWDGDVEGAVKANLQFPSGIKGQIWAAMNVEKFAAQLVVEGSRGLLRVSNPLAPQLGHEVRFGTDGDWHIESVAGPATFAAQLTAVCSSIRAKADFPLGVEDYVRSMAAIDSVRDGFPPR
jgi:predicted dehydrogenase